MRHSTFKLPSVFGNLFTTNWPLGPSLSPIPPEFKSSKLRGEFQYFCFVLFCFFSHCIIYIYMLGFGNLGSVYNYHYLGKAPGSDRFEFEFGGHAEV